MSTGMASRWRTASLAVVLGTLGIGLASLAVGDAASGPSAMRLARAGDGADPGAAADSSSAQMGLRLLEDAAVACSGLSYQGVQSSSWQGYNGTTTTIVRIWHQHDAEALVQGAGAPSGAPGIGPASAFDADPGGILWISNQLVALIRANYVISYAGRGSALNRPAQIVDVRQRDGSLVARYWLDAGTKLPLRREILADGARVISEDSFISLQASDRARRGAAAGEANSWGGQLGPAGLAQLRSMGWPIPDKLPGHLQLLAANETSADGENVVGLSYSDGLWLVSLFVQRGQLPPAMPGWRRISLAGQSMFAGDPNDRSLAWSSRGFVYTLIADAPPQTVGEVVADLPHGAEPGFWDRMARGFDRLVLLVNPFG